MEIFVSKTSDMVQDRKGEQPKKSKKNRFDRRKNRIDRRQSVQEGVVVSLSYREEKRNQSDRRQEGAEEVPIMPVLPLQPEPPEQPVSSAPVPDPPEGTSINIIL